MKLVSKHSTVLHLPNSDIVVSASLSPRFLITTNETTPFFLNPKRPISLRFIMWRIQRSILFHFEFLWYLLLAHLLRERDDAPVSLDGACQSQPDAGVPRRRLYQRVSGLPVATRRAVGSEATGGGGGGRAAGRERRRPLKALHPSAITLARETGAHNNGRVVSPALIASTSQHASAQRPNESSFGRPHIRRTTPPGCCSSVTVDGRRHISVQPCDRKTCCQ